MNWSRGWMAAIVAVGVAMTGACKKGPAPAKPVDEHYEGDGHDHHDHDHHDHKHPHDHDHGPAETDAKP